MVQHTKDYFLYFAYGSNLFKKRIRINNPSSIFAGPGQLIKHTFDFAAYNPNWQGAVSTIVPHHSDIVWGAIWKIHNKDLAALDRQEGVASREYIAKIVDVFSFGRKVKCRTYQHTFQPTPIESHEHLPSHRRPSITYINCIVMGAIESNLPNDYIQKLKKIPHNGKHAKAEIRKKLNI